MKLVFNIHAIQSCKVTTATTTGYAIDTYMT